MKPHTRRAVAYLVARLVTGKPASAVYDFEAGRHFHFSGDASSSSVNAYDHAEGCHIGGKPPSLYHYGNGKHFELKASGSQFSGYDYDSGKHFSGSVNGNSISLYDFESGKHYNFTV